MIEHSRQATTATQTGTQRRDDDDGHELRRDDRHDGDDDNRDNEDNWSRRRPQGVDPPAPPRPVPKQV